MWYKREARVLLFAAGVIFLTAGCASIQELETPKEANKNNELEQTIKEKDERIGQLEDLLNDQQQQLRQLNESLNGCKEKLKSCYKNQPNLK
ncbi:MAG: hypothetical protein ABIH18_06220 [Candidatus Omnitrophota bacterium]